MQAFSRGRVLVQIELRFEMVVAEVREVGWREVGEAWMGAKRARRVTKRVVGCMWLKRGDRVGGSEKVCVNVFCVLAFVVWNRSVVELLWV